MKKIYISTIDSTNQYVKENYQNMDSFTMVYSFHQTQGRGRWNRSWETGNQENIACSILIKPSFSSDKLPLFSLFSSLVVVNFLRDWQIETAIKWPNDILLNNKKVSGILIETIYTNKLEALIVGIGVNINAKRFDFGDNEIATSLYLFDGKLYSLEDAINRIAFWMETMYPLFENKPDYFLPEYQKLHAMYNKTIIYNDKKYQIGKVMQDGSLSLIKDGEIITVFSGKITFHEEYNEFIKST